ncbi:MAG: Fur family transcriptional regulator [Coriobacteriia bacterium]
MPITKAEEERRVASMVEGLRESGLRITHQRLEVAREIARTDTHPDVEGIYRKVRTRVPTISLDTVYRTLGVLAEKGLVWRVSTMSGPTRYDANLSHHHHFVCMKCGMVRDVIGDPALDEVRPSGDVLEHGSIESVEIQLRGTCTACAKKSRRKKKGADQ